MLWTLSLIRPRSCFLPQRRGGEGPVGSAESSKLKTSLCSTGGLQTWHAGGGGAGDILTPWHQTFHLASLSREYILSVTREVINCSDTSWGTVRNFGLYYTSDPKELRCRCRNHHAASLFIQVVMWCGGRSVGRLGLRHWTVASRGCDFISKAHHASFSCRSKATSPSVYWCTVRY